MLGVHPVPLQKMQALWNVEYSIKCIHFMRDRSNSL